jgi:hypothetical protein
MNEIVITEKRGKTRKFLIWLFKGLFDIVGIILFSPFLLAMVVIAAIWPVVLIAAIIHIIHLSFSTYFGWEKLVWWELSNPIFVNLCWLGGYAMILALVIGFFICIIVSPTDPETEARLEKAREEKRRMAEVRSMAGIRSMEERIQKLEEAEKKKRKMKFSDLPFLVRLYVINNMWK